MANLNNTVITKLELLESIISMQQYIYDQFDELYSRWSVLDKVGKEMQLQQMWNQLSGMYNYICQLYRNRGYLTPDEANYVNQIYHMLVDVQNEKMKVDQELAGEMLNHLVKMRVKQL